MLEGSISLKETLQLFQDLPLLGPLFGLRDEQQVFDHVLVFVISHSFRRCGSFEPTQLARVDTGTSQ